MPNVAKLVQTGPNGANQCQTRPMEANFICYPLFNIVFPYPLSVIRYPSFLICSHLCLFPHPLSLIPIQYPHPSIQYEPSLYNIHHPLFLIPYLISLIPYPLSHISNPLFQSHIQNFMSLIPFDPLYFKIPESIIHMFNVVKGCQNHLNVSP